MLAPTAAGTEAPPMGSEGQQVPVLQRGGRRAKPRGRQSRPPSKGFQGRAFDLLWLWAAPDVPQLWPHDPCLLCLSLRVMFVLNLFAQSGLSSVCVCVCVCVCVSASICKFPLYIKTVVGRRGSAPTVITAFELEHLCTKPAS